MKLNALYLKNFRNYKECFLSFSEGINAFFGLNAQGKTNLLEAIHVLMTGRSFRTPRLQELIYFDESHFYLEAHLTKEGVEQTIKFSFNGEEKSVFHNATSLPSLSSLFGILIGVVLSPEDRNLVHGQPSIRRQFLDFLIAKSDPLYVHHLNRFHRGLKVRNWMLRTKNHLGIESWEEELALSSAYISFARLQAVKKLEECSRTHQLTLSNSADNLSLSYKTSAKEVIENPKQLPSFFQRQFEKLRKKESLVGFTLTGPHRDDLLLFLNEKEARFFGSEGQQRSCVMALRLGEWNYLKNQIEVPPLICIDDVMISLDIQREKALYAICDKLGQVFLTSPRSHLSLPSSAICFEIQAGHCLVNQTSCQNTTCSQ